MQYLCYFIKKNEPNMHYFLILLESRESTYLSSNNLTLLWISVSASLCLLLTSVKDTSSPWRPRWSCVRKTCKHTSGDCSAVVMNSPLPTCTFLLIQAASVSPATMQSGQDRAVDPLFFFCIFNYPYGRAHAWPLLHSWCVVIIVI